MARRSLLLRVAAGMVLVGVSLASPADAQTPVPAGTFDTLTFHVNLGDRLTIRGTDGRLVRGTLVEITLDDLVLDTGGERRRLAAGAIAEVRKRDADPLSNGAARGLLVGAGSGLAAGLVAHHRNGSRPVPYVIFPSAVFAGAGTLIDARHRTDVVVLRTPPGRPVPPPPTTARAADALLLHLDLGDTVTVEDAGGRRVRGRLLGVTPDALVVGVGRDAARRESVARAGVRRIGRCCDSLRNGMLIGAIPMGALGFAGGLGFSEDTSVGAGLLLGGLMAGLGAGLGAGIDALVARDVDVFRADRPVTVRVTGGPGSVWVVLRF